MIVMFIVMGYLGCNVVLLMFVCDVVLFVLVELFVIVLVCFDDVLFDCVGIVGVL